MTQKRHLFVIVDGSATGPLVPRWTRDALDLLAADTEITVLISSLRKSKKRTFRHAAYYALNILSLRTPINRLVPLAGTKVQIRESVEFAALDDGGWSRLPDDLIDRINATPALAVLRFGLELVRIPDALKRPVLSYHHGDPAQFRGRPAGFYELTQGHPIVGQIVQRLNNRLDGGDVLAFAETRVSPMSWRATMREAFATSPLLLPIALERLERGETLSHGSQGRNYRLPANMTVVKATAQMAFKFASRLAYGAFWEKDWQVSTIPVADAREALSFLRAPELLPRSDQWTRICKPDDSHFLSDPFFSFDGSAILAESMNKKTCLGEIVSVSATEAVRLSNQTGHYSYPCVVAEEGQIWCVPEMAAWSDAMAYPMIDGAFGPPRALTITDGARLSDPTLFRHGDRFWLFANRKEEGSHVLRVWSAPSLFARFEPVSPNPVRISPRGSRMAGHIIAHEGRLFRLGQNFEERYGDGIIAFEILTIEPTRYEEREIGRLRFSEQHGPHTFNISPDEKRVVVDHYTERFSPLAWWRRIRNTLSQRGDAD